MTIPATNDDMSAEEFLQQLPELFASAKEGERISSDPRFAKIMRENSAAAELVRDLEYIAEQARMLLQPANEEPSADLWNKIQTSIGTPDKSKQN